MANVKSALNKGRKKKARIKNVEAADILKMYGPNPIYDGKGLDDPNYNSEFTRALNWCNRSLDQKELRKELVAWMESSKYTKTDITALRAVPDCFGIQDGKLSYLIHNNWPMSDNMIERMKLRIDKLIERGKILVKEKRKTDKEKNKVDKIKQDTKESPEAINFRDAQEIYDEIQDDILLKLKIDDERVRVITKGKKAVVLSKTMEMLKDLLVEIELIGNDDQVTEAYSYLKPAQTKKVIKLFNQTIDVIEGETLNNRTIRKPRATKAKSAAVQVKSVKYKTTDKQYNLVSVEPINIIGKSKIIVFNTKTRKIGLYYANDADGFSVKGTTIQNFDDKISEQKTLRNVKTKKIEDWLLEFRKAPIKKVDKLFESVKTTNVKMNGRLNADTIILKVYK